MAAEILVQSVLSDATRRNRKWLLAGCALAFAFRAGIRPTQVSWLGITLEEPDQARLSVLLGAGITYFVAVFLAGSMTDMASWSARFLLAASREGFPADGHRRRRAAATFGQAIDILLPVAVAVSALYLLCDFAVETLGFEGIGNRPILIATGLVLIVAFAALVWVSAAGRNWFSLLWPPAIRRDIARRALPRSNDTVTTAGVVPLPHIGRDYWDTKAIGRPKEGPPFLPHQRALFTFFHPRSNPADAFRSVVSRLVMLGLETDRRVVVYVHGERQAGTTTTLFNLAFAAAQSGTRILVCNADPDGKGRFLFLVQLLRTVAGESGSESLHGVAGSKTAKNLGTNYPELRFLEFADVSSSSLPESDISPAIEFAESLGEGMHPSLILVEWPNAVPVRGETASGDDCLVEATVLRPTAQLHRLRFSSRSDETSKALLSLYPALP